MASSADSSATDLEQLFVSNLPVIDRIIAIQARRHSLSRTDAEDFASWARERLMDNDYAVLRKFGGRSSLATYLAAVLTNMFRDFRNNRWGRWRPSAAAKRLGPTGIRLEELLYRDGYPLREASEIIRGSGTELTEREFARMVAQLPRRQRIDEVPLDLVGPNSDAEFAYHSDGIAQSDDEVARVIEATLNVLISELPPEDVIILRMRFWNDVSVADIARTLRLDQKSLYRRIDVLGTRLRVALAARGIDQTMAAEVLGGILAS